MSVRVQQQLCDVPKRQRRRDGRGPKQSRQSSTKPKAQFQPEPQVSSTHVDDN